MNSVRLGLVLTFIMLVAICTEPVYADSSLIKILGVQAYPSTIKVNNTFSINMTILNISPYPVFLTSGSCTPAFSVEFDSHVNKVYPNIACTTEMIFQKIDPLEETTISSANKPGTMYKAVYAGISNANITIPYFTKNQTSTDHSSIYYNASKSFQFQIYGVNETSAPPNSTGTPNGGAVTPLQTTNSSGGKMNIHVEKGADVSGKIMPPPVTANMEPHPQFQTPLQQFKSGIQAEDVKCGDGFTLVIKLEDSSPACVKPDTVNILIERGWAEYTTNGISQTGLTSNTVEIMSIQSISSLTNPGGPPIQLTLKNIGITPTTSLNATLALNNDYNFDFKNVTPSNPLASGDSISETKILIGAGFRTGLTYPITITGTTNNVPFTYTENIHMP